MYTRASTAPAWTGSAVDLPPDEVFMQPYDFYGQLVSYYSAKLRAYFQYKALPYRDHGATRATYKEIIQPRTGMRFVPVVITPEDEVLQDTCDVIETLEARHPDRPAIPTDPTLRFACALFEYYADECLIYPGLHMRWHYDDNREWILAEFARGSTGDAADADPGSARFAEIIQGYTDALGMATPEARAATRRVYDELMAALEEHFKHAPYLLGASPSLADVALMGPIFGHFYRDLYSSVLMRRDAPRVCAWVERMNMSNAAPSVGQWELLPSAAAVLRQAGKHFGALVRDSASALDEHIAGQAEGAQLERLVPGEIETRLGETPTTMAVLNSYWAYKQQRVRDAYHRVDADARGALDGLLAATGCEALLTPVPQWRVAKNDAGWLEVQHG